MADDASVGDRGAKDELFDAFAATAGALASGRRAEIVDVLAQGERSVEVIAREIAQSVANTSHHLRALARAGLVATRREGTSVHYRLASERVVDAWMALRAVAIEHVAGIDRLVTSYLGDRDGLETVSRNELARRLDEGGVTILDVRPPAEHAAGHIPGARAIAPGEVRRQLRGLPENTEVVAYCRGPYCVFADDAVRELVAHGFRARRLEDGFPEWKRAGLPVAVGNGGTDGEPA
jgi:rhodanese-related sulfurtransferase